jgi:hypothetical protein
LDRGIWLGSQFAIFAANCFIFAPDRVITSYTRTWSPEEFRYLHKIPYKLVTGIFPYMYKNAIDYFYSIDDAKIGGYNQFIFETILATAFKVYFAPSMLQPLREYSDRLKISSLSHKITGSREYVEVITEANNIKGAYISMDCGSDKIEKEFHPDYDKYWKLHVCTPKPLISDLGDF